MIAAIHGILEQYAPNRAAVFNGLLTDSFHAVVQNPPLLGNSFDFEMRTRITNPTQTAYVVGMHKTGVAHFFAPLYGFIAGKHEFYADVFTGTNPRTALATSVTDANWHVIRWTYDGVTLKGYLDGVLDVSRTITFSLNGQTVDVNVRVGSAGTNGPYKGDIDYVSLKKGTGSTWNTPVFNYNFNESTNSAAAQDSSGNGFNLTAGTTSSRVNI